MASKCEQRRNGDNPKGKLQPRRTFRGVRYPIVQRGSKQLGMDLGARNRPAQRGWYNVGEAKCRGTDDHNGALQHASRHSSIKYIGC